MNNVPNNSEAGDASMDCIEEQEVYEINRIDIEEDEQCELSMSYLDEKLPVKEIFENWSENEQLLFLDSVFHDMEINRLDKIGQLVNSYFQRDFISMLSFEIAVMVLEFVDPKTLAYCEVVNRRWREVIARGQLWRKTLERLIKTDSLWRTFGEKRKWIKYVLANREVASKLICEHLNKSYEQLKGTDDMIFIQHNFYKKLYVSVIKDMATTDDNWKAGNYNIQRINCDSHNNKGVYCLQYDDEKIISGQRDHTIKIWNKKDLSCSKILRGHTGSVLSLHFDDRIIISSSSDSTVRIWDVNTGDCLSTLTHHSDAVLHLKYNKGILVTCSKDRTVAVLYLISPTQIRLKEFLVGHRAAVNVVDFDENHIITASGDRTIKVWNTDTLEELQTLTGHRRGIACLQLRGRIAVSGSSDNCIRIWDIVNGVCRRVLEGHNELVRCVRFDNRKIVSGSYDGKIKVWDLDAALDLSTPPEKLCINTYHKHDGRVFRLQFDNFELVTSSHDDSIIIWKFDEETKNKDYLNV